MKDGNPYYLSYMSVPVSQIEAMIRMRDIIEAAVKAGQHKSAEADLRIAALHEALKDRRLQEKKVEIRRTTRRHRNESE